MRMKSFLMVAALAIATSGFTATVTYDFETDQSASFTEVELIPGDNLSNYQYDYSTHVQTLGLNNPITSAPSGTGTTGLRLESNIANNTANSITVYPDVTGLNVGDGAWSMTFDVWANFNGDLNTGSGTTEYWGFGAANDAAEPNTEALGDDGFTFNADTDGDSGNDYTYCEGTGGTMARDSAKANFNGVGETNNSDASWTAFFPNDGVAPNTVPVAGSTLAGASGKQWITVTLTVTNFGTTREVSFQKLGDATPTIVSTVTGGIGATDRPSLGWADTFGGSSGTPADSFGVFDNIVIDDLVQMSVDDWSIYE